MARTDSESPRLASSSGTWSPSPSPSPPASPKIIDIETLSPEDRIRILEQYAPMRPSELGLPSGTSPISGTRPGKDRKRDAKGKGKEPMVVLSPEELEKLVAKQQAGASPKNSLNNATTMDGESEEEDADEAEDDDDEPALWEDVANAVLWTIPFGFLFCGMDYAVHRQFGEWLPPAQEFIRLLNFLPALLLLNLFLTLSPSRSPFPSPSSILMQSILSLLSVTTGLLTIRTTTEEGYLRVMARAPGLGVIWCWTAVRLDLGWALLSLVGVAVGLWATGADVSWLKAFT
ncbi:hypothetical protein C6P46_001224 [Rhodotorula mucilaginosa]|uniref:DUF7719 domain-containing protein n=1 Tax=Rhodotorula mucilaginosa TaxID=5537 RepID=A0A9P7B8I2_RHOMI|nr:hypothetical protein C6P46_001224 [Rhodotorula mucilaginosa]